MTTSEFISLVKDEIGTSLTNARILEIVNRVQNEILARPNNISRVKPDPFFATSDDTYSYTASSSMYDSSDGTQGSASYDIRDVKAIYSFDNTANIFDRQTLDPSSEKPNIVTHAPTRDRVDYRFESVPSVAPDSSDCVIKLWEGNDPGDTTVIWRAECYQWPNQLTATSISLSLPAEFHDTLLLFGVLKRVERREYGNPGNAFEQFEFYKKQFYDRYSRTTSQSLRWAMPRDF